MMTSSRSLMSRCLQQLLQQRRATHASLSVSRCNIVKDHTRCHQLDVHLGKNGMKVADVVPRHLMSVVTDITGSAGKGHPSAAIEIGIHHLHASITLSIIVRK